MAYFCYIYIMNYVIGEQLQDLRKLDSKFSKPPYKTEKTPTGIIPNTDIVTVTGLTSNSIELFHQARTELGVDCHQWHGLSGNELKDFEIRFKKI